MTFLSYAARGKTAWWRYILAAIFGLSGGMALAVVAMLALIASHLVPVDLAGELRQPRHPLIFFPIIGLIFGGVLLGFIGATRLIQGKRFSDIIGAWRWGAFAFGAGLWLTVQSLAAFVDFVVNPAGFNITASNATGPLAAAALFGLAIQTFMEEFIFRGWLTQGLLLATRNPIIAALISGAVFGALHIPNGTPQAIEATAFGVVTALIAIRTGGLAFTYGLHLVNNLFGAIIVVSANDVFKGAPGLLSQHTPQLLGWDVVLGVAALLLALWVATRWWVFSETSPSDDDVSTFR